MLLAEALVGLVAGVLGGLLGIGGSLVIIPALIVYLSHTPGGYHGSQQHLLQAAAMIVNVFVAAPAVVAHRRAGAIMKSVVVMLIPSALAGIFLGVMLSNSPVFTRQNGVYLAMGLAGFLVYVVIYNTSRMFGTMDFERDFDECRKVAAWKVLVVGFPMGLTAGLLGIGGGAVCVPIQQILLRIPLRRAIANSAATIVCTACLGAVYKNLTLADHGVSILDSLRLALMLAPTAIVGGYLGGRLTYVIPRRALRFVFILVMATIAYLTFSKAWSAAPRPEIEPKPAATTTDSAAARLGLDRRKSTVHWLHRHQ